MTRKSKSEDTINEKLDLIDDLAESLNSQFKGLKVAYILDKDEDNPAEVDHWVSTGSTILDIAISNRPNGGLPFGRIVEIMGQSSSGKSLLAAHIAAETQKIGGYVVYYDTEAAMSKKFASVIGIDLSKMIYAQIETVEEIFESMEKLIEKIRKRDSSVPVTFIVDSVMGATTKVEMESDYDKDGWATAKAIVLSKAMRKITNLIAKQKILLVLTNQLRDKLGVTFGNNETTSGGKAIGFHSSVRLKMKNVGQIKGKVNNVEQVIGAEVLVQVVKNRIGPPFRATKFSVYFESGIDDIDSWLTIMKDYDLVKSAGAWFTYFKKDGEEIKFQKKDFNEKILMNPELKEEIYSQICENLIMKYKTENIAEENLIIDDNVILED